MKLELKNNKIIMIISGVIVAIILLLLIDFLVLKITGYGPLFAIKSKVSDSNEKIYNGIFYKAYKCDIKNHPHKVVIKPAGSNFTCDTLSLSKKDFIISDETGVCAQKLEEIARDDMFIYYLSCVKSSTIFLEYGDGTKISVKDALAKKKVTIRQLIDKGLVVYQEVIDKSKQ